MMSSLASVKLTSRNLSGLQGYALRYPSIDAWEKTLQDVTLRCTVAPVHDKDRQQSMIVSIKLVLVRDSFSGTWER